MDDTLLGVPVTRDLPCSLDDAAVTRATADKAAIEACGLTVTGVHISTPDKPLHFFVKFKPGVTSWESRAKLEKDGFDVRQKMTQTDLCFYVTRGKVETKGWTGP